MANTINSSTIQDGICQSIGIIVNRKIADANFNTTRKGIVVAVEDKATGKYRVKHQDAEWIAHGNPQINYAENTEVYLENVNNNTEQFFILGSVIPNVTEYINTSSNSSNLYDVIGMNLLDSEYKIALKSCLSKEIVLYEEGAEDNLLQLNPSAVENIKTANAIALSAYFQTNLSSAQFGGNYGLKFELQFEDDNEEGSTIIRTINLDSRNVIGNPYGLTKASKVENLFTELNPVKFVKIKSITAFTQDFKIQKEEEETTNADFDIFISNLSINGANPLTEEELTGYKLHINYAQNGKVLDSSTSSLKLIAELKAKGVIVTNDVEYYWFKQNATVFASDNSNKYEWHGGDGWQCLNHKKGKSFVPLTNGQFYVLSTEPKENSLNSVQLTQKKTVLKCVASYSGGKAWISGEVTIQNNNITDKIEIVSSDRLDNGQNKTRYYLDAGCPTFTCVLDDAIIERYSESKKEADKKTIKDYQFIYTWTTADRGKNAVKKEPISNDIFSSYYGENGYVNKYNQFYANYEKVPQSDKQEYAKQNGKTEIDENYALTKTEYCYDNIYYNFPLSSVINYKTISCGVEVEYTLLAQEDAEPKRVYLGTTSIIIYNIHELANTYSLNIENGSQVFQYDGKGNSPCSKTLENPLQIIPLTFTLIDSEGKQVTHDFIRQNGLIKWLIPKNNTLLVNTNSTDEATAADTDDYYGIKNLSSISYSIAQQYDSKKKNNDIQLYIQFQVNGQKVQFTGYTNLTFAKDGDPGTNGTDYVAKITPSQATDRVYISTQFPEEMFDDNGNTVDNLEFQLYNNSIKVDLGSVDNINYFKSLNKTENEFYNISNGFTTGNTQKIQITSVVDNRMLSKFPINILRGVYQLGNLKYYAEYPIIINYVTTTTSSSQYYYRFKVKPKTGFKYVQYASDGTSPNYDNLKPFEIIVQKYSNLGSTKKDGYFIQQDTGIYYEWFTVGNLKPIQSKNNHICFIEPKDTFDGYDLTSAVYVKFYEQIQSSQGKIKGNYLGYIYIPIYMMLNRYNNSALNDWDGNSIELGEENGTILAPQIGAGKKSNSDSEHPNTFTGIVMGVEKNKENEQIGLFGYESGQRSIFLDAETGNATFGKQGAGQIKIDARSDEGTIQSGDYQYSKERDSEGNPLGKGMKIKFSSTGRGEEEGPYIRFGSSDFEVDSKGHITAKGGGTIAGWNITDSALLSPTTVTIGGTPRQYTPLKLGIDEILFKDNTANTLFNVKNDGTAQIAGWTFDQYKFSKNKAGINSVTTAGATGSKTINNKAVAFYAGDNKFYVTHDGYLKSVDGQIANWNISSSSLNDGNLYLGNGLRDAFGVEKIQARIWDKNNNFILSNDGTIYSKAGKIGGWNIENNRLYGGTDTQGIRLNSNGDINGGNPNGKYWSISRNGHAFFNDIETNDMTANSINVTSGNINNVTATNIEAKSGHIGQVTIDSNGLTGTNWWIRSDNAHFKGLIVDSNDIKSSSSSGIQSSGYSGGTGSGWSMPAGNGKPAWKYDEYTMQPIKVRTVGVLALSKVHPQETGNYFIPSGLKDLEVVTAVDFDAKKVTTTTIKEITGYAIRDWIVQGWGSSTSLPQYEVMASTNYTGASTAENT